MNITLFNLLNESSIHETCMILISNEKNNSILNYSSYNILAAYGAEKTLSGTEKPDFFEELKLFLKENNDWLFGHFSYDLKNHIEKLHSGNADYTAFKDGFFFVPEKIIINKNGTTDIIKDNTKILKTSHKHLFNKNSSKNKYQIKARVSRKEYIDTINCIKEHIHRGDIFEVNYCFEFYIEDIEINPEEVFQIINEISPMPFAGFYKNGPTYLLCFSPERFIKKTGNKVISQPMKGTNKKGITVEENRILKKELSENAKERAENIMITDLVRNDLSKIALQGTVNVEELCKVYEFKQVNQMISTVAAEIQPDIHPVDIIKNAFPMGSMTGAPKVKAMELIEKYEKSKRGIYSGSIGYFTKDMDFDFNVVIRSIGYNKKQKYLSFMVGSAITSLSDPEKEYEECLLKAKAIYDWLFEY